MASRHVLAVPVEYALAYTAARGWHVLAAPPAEWLEEHVELADELERRSGESRRQQAQDAARTGWAALTLEQRELRVQAATAARWGDSVGPVGPIAPALTLVQVPLLGVEPTGSTSASCRPDNGPSRRRHEHTAERRAAR